MLWGNWANTCSFGSRFHPQHYNIILMIISSIYNANVRWTGHVLCGELRLWCCAGWAWWGCFGADWRRLEAIGVFGLLFIAVLWLWLGWLAARPPSMGDMWQSAAGALFSFFFSLFSIDIIHVISAMVLIQLKPLPAKVFAASRPVLNLNANESLFLMQ